MTELEAIGIDCCQVVHNASSNAEASEIIREKIKAFADAATAKLREELEQLKREQQVLLDIHAALGIKWGDDPYAVINKLKQLAHQQPSPPSDGLALASAPTPEAGNHDCEYPSENEDARCVHCGLTSGEAVKYFEGLSHNQIAPTPDVEKIAREARLRINNEVRTLTLNEYQQVDEIIQHAIAQARAPLVAALMRMPELAYEVLITRESAIRPIDLAMELQCICDAALQQ